MYFIGDIENTSERQMFFPGNQGKGLKPPMPVLLIQLALTVVSKTQCCWGEELSCANDLQTCFCCTVKSDQNAMKTSWQNFFGAVFCNKAYIQNETRPNTGCLQSDYWLVNKS